MREEHEYHTIADPELSSREVGKIIVALASIGIKKIRFTGGEPLLRKDISVLVRQAKSIAGIKTVSLTTNGILLDRHLDELIDAGLDAINLSLDTLDRERYLAITRRNEFDRVMSNLETLLAKATFPVKLNVVMMRGVNGDEIKDFIELTRTHSLTVRFMELQPFDDNQIWKTGKFMGIDKITEQLRSLNPGVQKKQGKSTEYFSFSLPGHQGSIAVIPAYTRNFCSSCNRIRITSHGKIISCLYDKEGLDLMPLLRNNADNNMLTELFRHAAAHKPADGKSAAEGQTRTSMSEIGG
jgi:cyclic pyranopterin phosphate synthase